MNNDKWDIRFLDLARHISSWSHDPSTSVGAVVINPKSRRVLSMGYNGFPIGIEDSTSRLSNRKLKNIFTVHAEMNAIYNATRNGISLNNNTIYIFGLPPCSECAKGLIQVGIKRIVYKHDFIDIPERWIDSMNASKKMCNEAGIIMKEFK